MGLMAQEPIQCQKSEPQRRDLNAHANFSATHHTQYSFTVWVFRPLISRQSAFRTCHNAFMINTTPLPCKASYHTIKTNNNVNYRLLYSGKIWRIGEFAENCQIKKRQTLRYCVMRRRSVSVVAKLKTRQYVLKMDSPNFSAIRYFGYLDLALSLLVHGGRDSSPD